MRNSCIENLVIISRTNTLMRNFNIIFLYETLDVCKKYLRYIFLDNILIKYITYRE